MNNSFDCIFYCLHNLSTPPRKQVESASFWSLKWNSRISDILPQRILTTLFPSIRSIWNSLACSIESRKQELNHGRFFETLADLTLRAPCFSLRKEATMVSSFECLASNLFLFHEHALDIKDAVLYWLMKKVQNIFSAFKHVYVLGIEVLLVMFNKA